MPRTVHCTGPGAALPHHQVAAKSSVWRCEWRKRLPPARRRHSAAAAANGLHRPALTPNTSAPHLPLLRVPSLVTFHRPLAARITTAAAAMAQQAGSDPVGEAKVLVAELCAGLYSQGHVSGTGGGISIKVDTPQGDRIVMAPSGVQVGGGAGAERSTAPWPRCLPSSGHGAPPCSGGNTGPAPVATSPSCRRRSACGPRTCLCWTPRGRCCTRLRRGRRPTSRPSCPSARRCSCRCVGGLLGRPACWGFLVDAFVDTNYSHCWSSHATSDGAVLAWRSWHAN